MSVVQVIIDRTSPMIIQGLYQFDSVNGGSLVVPAGSSFPVSPTAGEIFWRSDEVKLYRRSDDNLTWESQEGVTLSSSNPEPVGSTASPGTSTSASASDHVHAHGSQTSETDHAVATVTTAGFQSALDKVALDSLVRGNVTVPVRNETGGPLLAGKAVYVVDWDSPTQVVLVDYADNTDPNKRPAIGILPSDLPDNTTGTVTLQGHIEGLDTSSWFETDQLVLGTSGSLIRPPPDNSPFVGEIQNIGFVGRVHPAQGTFVVNIDGMSVVTGPQVFALTGTDGTPGPANKYVTSSDARLSDDRTASGLRTATTTVAISTATAPTAGQTLVATSSTAATWQTVAVGTGDVVGPAISTDNAVARFDLATGKLLQNSVVTVGDTGIVAGVLTLNGVTVETHASRHAPGGADALTVATPSSIGTANSAGTLTSFVRADHVHNHGEQSTSTHHAVVSGTINGFMPAVGASGTVAQSTGTAAAWVSELTNPQKVAIRKNTGLAVGSRPRLNFIEGSNVTLTVADDATDNEVDITIAAASGVTLASTTPSSISSTTGTVGTGTTAARSDHTHQVLTAAPSTLVVGGSNTAGVGPNLALSDHVHALPAFGTTTGTFCQGDDIRLSDDRTASGLRTATTTVAISTATAPTTGQFLRATSSTAATWQTVTIGNVVGPASSTDNAVARFNLATGKLLQNSVVTIGDTGVVAGVLTLNGVTVETHASRHAPGGADALTVATPSTLVVGGSNTAGTSTSFIRADHVHALPAFGVTAGTFCQGDDIRLSDDRTASGLRTATTTVAISTATAPTAGQTLVATSSTAATWQTPSSGGGGGGGGGLNTHSVGLISVTSIDVNQNNSTWGGLTLAASDMSINSLSCWVYQAAGSGDVQGGIYDASTDALIATTGTVSVTTTGIKTMSFASPVSLVKDTLYYLAIMSTGNGSRFCGTSSSSFNLYPKPAFISSGQLPATLSPNSATSLVWIQANT